MRWFIYGLIFLVLVYGAAILTSWLLEPKPYGPAVAPRPSEHPAAVVQVYGANVWGVRGYFAIHTWLAIKPENASTYTIYQVIGWRRERSKVSVTTGMPDGRWFRSEPILLHEVRGAPAQALIEPIRVAVRSYPWAETYTMWPGPNSNSFIAWLGLEVPGLGLDLPAKAIGATWMHDNYPQPD
ncbi:MAG: DUF3750 domain-containing protein [Pseudomonadota bacterium]